MCSRTQNSAYVLSNFEYCAPIRVSSAESHLCLLDSIVSSAEWLREGKFIVWDTEGGSVP